MTSFFILEDWLGEQFRRVAVGELGKVFLILPHKIHDVTQTLNVQHIALQHVHHINKNEKSMVVYIFKIMGIF